MKSLLPAAVTLAFLLIVTRAHGDTVELRSGGKLTGEIVEETPDVVAVRTEAGVIRVGRDQVVRIRRLVKAPPEQNAPERRSGRRIRIEQVSADVPPVVTRGNLVLAMEQGGVTSVDVATGLKPEEFTEDHRLGPVTGLAADGGAIYIATKDGAIARIDRITGHPLWTTPIGRRAHGAPVLLRRWVFVVAPGRGLLKLESSTGTIRSTLPLDIQPDTPLVPAAAGLAIGSEDGTLLLISGDGETVLQRIETPRRWFGSPPAITLNRVALAGKETLLLTPLVEGTSAREAPVGLMRHPLAADPARVYCKLMGALTALAPLTGRALWRSTEAGESVHLALGSAEILTTTSDGQLCAVSLGSGKLLWSVSLGSQGTSPPVRVRDRVAVVTERGVCEILDPSDLPPDEAPVVKVAPSRTQSGRLRSPDGYSIQIPDRWVLSKRLSKGNVSVGLQPSEAKAREQIAGISEADLSELLQSGHIMIRVIGAGDENNSDLALTYLMAEQERARTGGYRLGPPSITKTLAGGRQWTQVELRMDLEVPGGSRTLLKQALVTRMQEDRAVWIELLTPVALREHCAADLRRLVGSFELEE